MRRLLLFTFYCLRVTWLAQALTTTQNQHRHHKILVLGGTGFLGQEVVHQLDALGLEHVDPTRQELDLLSSTAQDQVAELCRNNKCTAVITCVGSLLGNQDDEKINASNGQAAMGALQSGCVEHFVSIGNDPKVRSFSKTVGFLKAYASGKEQAEQQIRDCFSESYTIVSPTVIHGGQDLSLNPPRIPASIGGLAESVLGLYPFQSAADALPGVLGISLQAPISKESVAKACVHAALGLPQCQGDLDSRDAILQAASKRPQKVLAPLLESSTTMDVNVLQQKLYDLGDCGGEPDKLDKAFALLEDIEKCNTRQPTIDTSLNGRWDFVLDIEADLGTSALKEIIKDDSTMMGMVFDLTDLYMQIQDNEKVAIHVNTKVLGQQVDLVLTTTLIPEESDPTGTTFLEQFEGVEIAGQSIPIPKEWQRARPLEFSYLDDSMLIARGNGEKPHYLKR